MAVKKARYRYRRKCLHCARPLPPRLQKIRSARYCHKQCSSRERQARWRKRHPKRAVRVNAKSRYRVATKKVWKAKTKARNRTPLQKQLDAADRREGKEDGRFLPD